MNSEYFQKKRKLEKQGRSIPAIKQEADISTGIISFVVIFFMFLLVLLFVMVLLSPSDREPSHLELCQEAKGKYVPIERRGKTTIYGCVMENEVEGLK